MKKVYIIALSVMLCSCGTVGKLIPKLSYDKDNQSTSSADTLSQSIGHASLSLTAGTNKAKTYGDKSNIKSSDLNTDSEISQDTRLTSFGGTHYDNSKKSLINTTSKDNQRTNYNSSANQIIYNKTPIIDLLLILCFISIISAVIVYVVYKIGITIGRLKTKLIDIKFRYNNYRIAKKDKKDADNQ